jgi:hypothetical protein
MIAVNKNVLRVILYRYICNIFVQYDCKNVVASQSTLLVSLLTSMNMTRQKANRYAPFHVHIYISNMMIQQIWLKFDNLRFHTLLIEQLQSRLSSIDSQEKKNGKVFSNLSSYSFFLSNTIIISKLSIAFTPICIPFNFDVNSMKFEYSIHYIWIHLIIWIQFYSSCI